MENKKEYCEKLIKRWKELKGKLLRDQNYIPGKSFKSFYVSPKEVEEYYETMEQLKNECQEFLSPAERFEINEIIKAAN